MKTVGLIKSWTYPDVFRQSPGGKGIWERIHVTTDLGQPCDYVLVSNYSKQETTVICPPDCVWCVLQEPPNEFFGYWHRAASLYHQVFTQDPSVQGARYIHTQPAIAWQVNKTYDELISMKMPQKRKALSWITSLKQVFAGHKARMEFLSNMRKALEFDLIATHQYHEAEQAFPSPDIRKEREQALLAQGYDAVVEGKWEGLAPYQYALVIENFRGRDYWSEKLADAFLSWTIPIYYGCTNLSDYFPEDSYIEIDIQSGNGVDMVRDILSNDQWKKRLPAVAKARDFILNKYQLFPFIARHIDQWEQSHPSASSAEIRIPNEWSRSRKAGYYLWRAQQVLAAQL